MDNNKIKKNGFSFEIKPSFFVSLGYIISVLAGVVELYNTEGLTLAMLVAGLGLIGYGVVYAIVKNGI